ncbi:MAG: flagellar motor protein MotB [Bacillota bacterium]
MPRDRDKNDDDGGADWMTTYGDMMTLLLAFFVLLYSFSSLDANKFQMMIEGLQGKLGVLDGGKTISSEEMIDAGLNQQRSGTQQLSNLNTKIEEYVKEEGLENDVETKITDKGLTVRFTGKVLFDLGEAEIKDASKSILDKMAGFIKTVPNNVMVEGHTDDLPISNEKFPSNWELSTTRATNVIRYFIEGNDINPSRLSASGYSKHKPIVPNENWDNRMRNRRVDIVILRMDENDGGGEDKEVNLDG